MKIEEGESPPVPGANLTDDLVDTITEDIESIVADLETLTESRDILPDEGTFNLFSLFLAHQVYIIDARTVAEAIVTAYYTAPGATTAA